MTVLNRHKRLVYFLRVQNLHHINQRKGNCFIQELSDNEDDKDDEYDRKVFHDRNAQNLRCIKQRKGRCFIQASVTIRTIKTMISFPPIYCKISVPKCNHQKQTPLLKPVCRFVRFFQRNRKSTHLRAFGA